MNAGLNIIVLCNHEMALPAIRELIHYGVLKAVVVPEKNRTLTADFRSFFTGSQIQVVSVSKKNVQSTLRSLVSETKCHAALVMTFPYILPSALLTLPLYGFI